jgi:murein DD-endopeptidase MepM/ murein hydrolase activator NlpD
MKSYIRKAVAFVLVLCLALPLMTDITIIGSANADIDAKIKEAEDKAKQLQEQNQKLEAQIKAMRGDMAQQEAMKRLIEQQIAGVNARINTLDDLIDLKQQAIGDKKAEIARLEQRICDTETEIEIRYKKIGELEKENAENKQRFAEMVRNSYMTGDYGFISVIMGAGDFFDLIVRADVLRKASERETEFMESLLAAIDEQEELIEGQLVLQAQLDADRIECEAERAQLELDLEQLNTQMQALDAEKTAEQTKLAEFAEGITDLQNQISAMNSQFNATAAQLKELDEAISELIKQKQVAGRTDYSGEGFRWPLDSRFQMITCRFGFDPWRNGQHNGTDIGNAGIGGANIYAMQSGTVIVARTGWNGGFGNYVIIDHGGSPGITTVYAHMRDGTMRVSEGQQVTKGDIIGAVGRTGWSTGDHLHFEVRVDGRAVDPMNFTTYEFPS